MKEVEICCDGCGLSSGGYGPPSDKIVLCPMCTPEDCTTDKLIMDGGYPEIVEQRLKIAEEMEKEREITHEGEDDFNNEGLPF
jgi:hypothetical protein